MVETLIDNGADGRSGCSWCSITGAGERPREYERFEDAERREAAEGRDAVERVEVQPIDNGSR